MVIIKTSINHVNMYIALNTILLEAVDNFYLHELQNGYTGYLGVTRMDLINHLMDPCGKITLIYIKNNKDRM